MKKSLIEIVHVLTIFKELTNKHFNNFTISYKIAKALKSLEEQTDFYTNEEKKLVDEYAVRDKKTGQIVVLDGNRIKFEDDKKAIEFNKKLIELQKTEVDIFDTITIRQSDFKNNELDLTPNDILQLEGFINFVDDTNAEVVN